MGRDFWQLFAVAEVPVVAVLLNLWLVVLLSLVVQLVQDFLKLLEQVAEMPLPLLVVDRSALREDGVGPKRSAALLAVDARWRHASMLNLRLQLPLFRSESPPQTLVPRVSSGAHSAPMPACCSILSSCLLQTGLPSFGSSHAVPPSGCRHGHPRTTPASMPPGYCQK